jgi:tetratricopeptide (TPR) repeat protein
VTLFLYVVIRVMKYILQTFLYFILWLNASATFEFNPRLESAYKNILSLHFREASLSLNAEKADNRDNHLVLLYENYIDFLKAFISEEKPLFEALKRNASNRMDYISNKGDPASPYFLYSLAEMNIQVALVKIKFEENIGAATEIRKAFKLIERNRKKFPSFLLNSKVSGFLRAIVGAVPAKYNWVVNLAGMDGSISSGLSELENCYNFAYSGGFKSYQTEILFYLGTIYSVFLPVTTTIPLIETMKEKSVESPLICYVYSNIMMKRGENDESLRVLHATLAAKDIYPFTFLYYKRGLCKLRKLDLSAAEDFSYFLNNYHGINNIKSAWQKLAWIGILNKDTDVYLKNLKTCSVTGSALLDEDKDAQYESVSGEVSNVILLRARLFFDGGYYQKSLAELSGRNISEFHRFRDQLEITYRLGRIMQMTGQTDKAIHNYEITIKNGSSSHWHFAANSSLMLGMIYEEKEQYSKAESYYKLCISLEFDQYKNSIDQKAQAGIDRINHLGH